MKGSRIIVLYSLGSRSGLYQSPRAAVRKRPGVEQYEAVTGYEDFGTRRGNSSKGMVWKCLHGVYPTALAAKDALAEIHPNLRPVKR